MIDIAKYQQEIAEGDLVETISGLKHDFNAHLTDDASEEVEEMYRSVIQFSARLNRILKKEFKGMISDKSASRKRNKLSDDLLKFLSFVKVSKNVFQEKQEIITQESDDTIDLGFDVFLSFSSKDIVQVKKIASILRKAGLIVFASNDSLSSKVGESYFDSIKYAIKNSRNFLLLSTPNAAKSIWVEKEWQMYFNKVYSSSPENHRIIVFRGHGFKFDDVDDFLESFQNTGDINEVIRSIKGERVTNTGKDDKTDQDTYTDEKTGVKPDIDAETDKKADQDTGAITNEDTNLYRKLFLPTDENKVPDQEANGLIDTRTSEKVQDKLRTRKDKLAGETKRKENRRKLLVVLSVVGILLVVAFAVSRFAGSYTTDDNKPKYDPIEVVKPNQNTTGSGNSTQVAVPSGPITTMSFAKKEIDFGQVKEGVDVVRFFKFKNSGSEPLLISDLKGACGCSVPEVTGGQSINEGWIFAPGASGIIKFTFKTKNKKGARNQKVTITANTNPAHTFIFLTGTVNP